MTNRLLTATGWVLFVWGTGLACASQPGGAAVWPQWRGTSRDGAGQLQRPDVWPPQLGRVWSVEVGEGHSTPVADAQRVYVFARQGEEEVLLALDRQDGREVYRRSYAAPYQVHSAATEHGAGPKSTPVLADGRLFTLGIGGILSAWEAATGRLVWQRKFDDRFSATSPLYGTAMSPLVVDGLLLAHVGGHDNGALLALDVRNGEIRWTYDGDGPSYASPIVAQLGGVRHLVTQTQTQCVGIDIRNGTRLWSQPFTTQYDQNSVTPVVAAGRVVLGGYQQPTFALELKATTAGLRPQVVWRNADIPLYMSTPVAAGDVLFGLTQRNSGQLFCADVHTGQLRWRGPPRWGDNAALVDVGHALLVLTDRAVLYVVARDPDAFRLLAQYTVAETPTWAHPVPLGDGLLIKDRTHVTRWRLGR
jgi:outer membrane protein assembly factor BamB